MPAKPRALVLLFALALLSGACGNNGTDGAADGDISLSLGGVPSSVEGNVVTLPATVEGVEIVKADGDTSGDSGHFHVFIDREPVEEGEVIPKERGVVHSADNPIKLFGLEPGEHKFTVVLGDGTHQRMHGDVTDSVSVDVEGPSVWGSVPATIDEGDDVTVDLKSKGVKIVAADGKESKKSGHLHVLVDPMTPVGAGDLIAAPEEGKIYHTTESSVTIPDLAKGEHIIWVVLGDGTHHAFEPAVMDKLTVTVT